MLLGCTLHRELDGREVVVRIVETEAYDEGDPASHAFGGERQRNKVMFGPSGRLYTYFTYGMHYCANVVAETEGRGAGVLLRAVEPVIGAEVLEARRGMTGKNITNGPAKLAQALGIDMAMSGHDLRTSPLRLEMGELEPGENVVQTTRIGISKAADWPRRFYIEGNQYVSKRVGLGRAGRVKV